MFQTGPGQELIKLTGLEYEPGWNPVRTVIRSDIFMPMLDFRGRLVRTFLSELLGLL